MIIIIIIIIIIISVQDAMAYQKDESKMESAFTTQITTSTSTSATSTKVSPKMDTTPLASTIESTSENSTSVLPMMETTPASMMEPPTNASATDSSTHTAKDCDDIGNQGNTENYSIYEIQPDPICTSQSAFEVVCNFKETTDCGGGWIMIQRRFDGSENFYRGWDDYKNGFGNLTGEHWLGLEKLHRLTRNGHWKLRVELEDFSDNTLYAEYTDFSIGDSSTYYRLRYNEYIGAAGDSLALNKYSAFTTYDMDHDRYDRNCAQAYEGAWWYSHCTGGQSYYNKANLNGPYIPSPTTNLKSMTWYDWMGSWIRLKKTEMKIRRMIFW